jgi:hypothetical protein
MWVSNWFDADFDGSSIIPAGDADEPHTVLLRMNQFFPLAFIEIARPVGKLTVIKLPDFVNWIWGSNNPMKIPAALRD